MPCTPRSSGQLMSRIFQAGYDQVIKNQKIQNMFCYNFNFHLMIQCFQNTFQMNTPSEKRLTPRSSPFKTPASLSPNYCLFNSPESQIGCKSTFDENDPFKSPLPVKKCLKRKYAVDRPPLSVSSHSFGRASPFSSSFHRRPFGSRFYKAKRKLPIKGSIYSRDRVKRFCGEKRQFSPPSPFVQRRKGKLNFISTPDGSRMPEVSVNYEEGNKDLSPEIPMLSTPQQRKLASAQFPRMKERNVHNSGANNKTFRVLVNDRTVLQFNKPGNSHLDCDSQSDEESVIDDCLSPENTNTSEGAANDDEKKVETLTKSLKETDIGRTEKVVNLLDEGLCHLLQSQKKSQKKYHSGKYSMQRQSLEPPVRKRSLPFEGNSKGKHKWPGIYCHLCYWLCYFHFSVFLKIVEF